MEWNYNITEPRMAKKELKKHGFSCIREVGDHKIYTDGEHVISLVNNKRRFSKITWAESIKNAYKGTP